MTPKQKERILKMIEVYMSLVDMRTYSKIHINQDYEFSYIAVHNLNLLYADDKKFDEKIKEMEEYIKGVKGE